MDFAALDQYSRIDRLAAEMAQSGVGRAAVGRWLEELPDPCGQAVLDLGCGEGAALEAMTCAVGLAGTAVGLDVSGALLKRAKVRAALGLRLSCVQGRVEALPFPDRCFDLVWCDRVLSHVSDVRRALSEMLRVLRPGGWMFISLFDYSALRWCGNADAALEALRQAYVGSVRQPALAGGLADEMRSLGLHIEVEVRDRHLLGKGREILRGTAGLHWLRQALERGVVAVDDLVAAMPAWRAQCAFPQVRLQVDVLTVIASRSP